MQSLDMALGQMHSLYGLSRVGGDILNPRNKGEQWFRPAL